MICGWRTREADAIVLVWNLGKMLTGAPDCRAVVYVHRVREYVWMMP